MPTPYVFVCAGCGLLAESTRSDALTCSRACRVRAHRNGALKQLRREATKGDVPPALMLQIAAALRLAPHLEKKVMSGRLKVASDDFKEQVWQALLAHLKAHNLL